MMPGDTQRLTDHLGRRITYARLSATDRRNLDRVYCAPYDGFCKKPRGQMPRPDEIRGIALALVRLGDSELP